MDVGLLKGLIDPRDRVSDRSLQTLILESLHLLCTDEAVTKGLRKMKV